MTTSNEDIMFKLGEMQADIRNTNHNVTKLSNNMASYTEECSKDRNAQDKRLTAVEGYQGRQLKVSGTAGGVIALLTTLAVEWWHKG